MILVFKVSVSMILPRQPSKSKLGFANLQEYGMYFGQPEPQKKKNLIVMKDASSRPTNISVNLKDDSFVAGKMHLS